MDNWNNQQSNSYGQQYDTGNQYQNQWGSQPVQQQNWGGYPSNETVGVGEWILMYIICMIPCLNIIMLCVWAFGSGTKPSKRNYSRAMIIISMVLIVLMVLFVVIFGAVGITVSSSM